MSDHDYEYRPASDETRARQSASIRARLGIPPGYRRLYGFLVRDDENYVELRVRAGALRYQTNSEVTAVMMPGLVAQVQRGDPPISWPSKQRATGFLSRRATPRPAQQPAQEPPAWIIVATGSPYGSPLFWHHTRRGKMGWWPDAEGALRFPSRSEAERRANKFLRRLKATPICLAEGTEAAQVVG